MSSHPDATGIEPVPAGVLAKPRPDCGHGEVLKCELFWNGAWHSVQWCWECLEPYAVEGLTHWPPEVKT